MAIIAAEGHGIPAPFKRMECISFRHALPLAMEMQRARETVSYREAAYARLDGWMGFAFKEMPSSRVPFTVEILKFPYGRVS